MAKLAWKVTRLTTIFAMSLPYIAVAASSNSEFGDLSSDAPNKIDSSMIGQVVWVFVALAIVVGLLVLTIKFLSKRNRAWGTHRGLRSLGGISLGQHSSMQVIEIANRIYIVGVGEQVTLLDKEDDPEKVAQLIAELEFKDQQTFNFGTIKDWLSSKKSVQKEENYNNDTYMWNDSKSFEDLLLSKLDKQAERKQELESLLKDKNK